MSTKKQLNQSQASAVFHGDGPMLVVAGAGTGKTTVLIERLRYLFENNLAAVDQILITTFTEKAAGEMEERADKILPYGYVNLWICTFHGLCERILREHAIDIGLPADFKLINQTESWILIKKNFDKFKLNYYRPLGNPTKFIHELLKHFSRLKDEDIKPEEYLKYAEDIKLDKDSITSSNSHLDINEEVLRINELASAYHVYNKSLLDNGYLDFGDLITYTIKLFKNRPNILEFYRNKFKYIMVDEFQDTNYSQNKLIKVLACPNNNIMAVGDDNQSVYAFRGTSMHNIMQFKDIYPDAKEVVLSDNYRSGQIILDKAYKFIQNNNPNTLEVKLGINKELKAHRGDIGGVEYITYQDEYQEIFNTVERIKNLFQKNQDAKWSDFAILVRANSTALNYIDELIRQNIPHQFMSLRGLYYKPIILDIISYLKLLDNYHESSALYRVLNIPLFKIGYEDIVKINKFARNKLWSLFEALKNINAIRDITPESVVKINKLLSLIESHSRLAQSNRPSNVLVSFLYDSGLIESLNIDTNKDEFSYLNQFYQKIKKFESTDPYLKLNDFMEMMDLELEAGETGMLKQNFEDSETIKVMTVHASKGLEFKYVFMPNIVDKKFPTIKRTDKIQIPNEIVREKLLDGDTHIEEERRLFYVAITRARDCLYITNARDYGGVREKKPSKFIEEAQIFNQEQFQENQKFKDKLEILRDIEDLKNPKLNTPVTKYQLPAKFSFSQIAAFANCPLQYKYNFILRIPVPEKPVMQFGRLMHNVLNDFFTPFLIDTISQASLFGAAEKLDYKPKFNDLLNIYKNKWIDFGFDSKEQRDEYKKQGRDILKGFFNNLDLSSLPKVVALEKSFQLKIKDFILRGSIDRVDELLDGTLEIIDYKTGSPKNKLTADDKRQLIIYKLALEQIYAKKVSKLTFYYLNNNSTLSFEAKLKDLEKVQERIIDSITEIKKCNFIPKPGMLCAYCDFNKICEFKQK